MARLSYLTVAIVIAVASTAPASQTEGNDRSKFRLVTGVVTAVSATAVIVGRDGIAMMFDVDSSTRVIGQSAKPRDLLNRRERRATDLIKVGDRVTVTYRRSGKAMTAVELRVSRSATP